MQSTFTVEQANRTLPLVRKIVEDILRHYTRWQEMMATCEVLLASNEPSSREQAEFLQRDIQATAAAIDRFIEELGALGVLFKGFDLGLVDFPAVLAGRGVFLCWRMGEPGVTHWHELDAGFAGRQPLPP